MRGATTEDQAFQIAVDEGARNLVRRPGQALIVILSVAIGVALAIAIIAAGKGVEEKVDSLLGGQSLPPQVDVDEIHLVLDEARALLRNLSYAVTVVLVGTATWITIGRRKREVGLKRQYGVPKKLILTELWTEALILCGIGGVSGVALGYFLCDRIQGLLPSLPMNPAAGDVVAVFPIVTGIAFAATLLVASYLVLTSTSDPEL